MSQKGYEQKNQVQNFELNVFDDDVLKQRSIRKKYKDISRMWCLELRKEWKEDLQTWWAKKKKNLKALKSDMIGGGVQSQQRGT